MSFTFSFNPKADGERCQVNRRAELALSQPPPPSIDEAFIKLSGLTAAAGAGAERAQFCDSLGSLDLH
jgi:hypothetical protein